MPACPGSSSREPGPDPEAERDRADRGHLLGDDPDARVQSSVSVCSALNAIRLVAALARSPPSRSRRHAVASATAATAAAVAAVAAAGGPPSPVPIVASSSGDLALDRRVVGEAQADAAALAVDLDHA